MRACEQTFPFFCLDRRSAVAGEIAIASQGMRKKEKRRKMPILTCYVDRASQVNSFFSVEKNNFHREYNVRPRVIEFSLSHGTDIGRKTSILGI